VPFVVDRYLRFRVATSHGANAGIGERRDVKLSRLISAHIPWCGMVTGQTDGSETQECCAFTVAT
jgi:hypothetical protein